MGPQPTQKPTQVGSQKGVKPTKMKYSEKEIISDISSMLTEMNEILDRMTSSGVKMRANDDSYFEAATSFPQNQTLKVDESMGRSGLRSHDIRYYFISYVRGLNKGRT